MKLINMSPKQIIWLGVVTGIAGAAAIAFVLFPLLVLLLGGLGTIGMVIASALTVLAYLAGADLGSRFFALAYYEAKHEAARQEIYAERYPDRG